VRNTGVTTAELWMTPKVLAGSHTYRAQPAPGSSFPEQLQPGTEASGWLALGGVPSDVLDRPLFVKLDGIATDGYSEVGKIAFPIMLG
jgi:hypothetical protein